MRKPFERLEDILEAIAKIEARVADGHAVFEQDEMVRVWIVHHLEIIGEAASALPVEWRTRYGDVPWGRIVATRNRLAHAYFDLDMNRVWEIATEDLPALRGTTLRMLSELEREDTTE